MLYSIDSKEYLNSNNYKYYNQYNCFKIPLRVKEKLFYNESNINEKIKEIDELINNYNIKSINFNSFYNTHCGYSYDFNAIVQININDIIFNININLNLFQNKFENLFEESININNIEYELNLLLGENEGINSIEYNRLLELGTFNKDELRNKEITIIEYDQLCLFIETNHLLFAKIKFKETLDTSIDWIKMINDLLILLFESKIINGVPGEIFDNEFGYYYLILNDNNYNKLTNKIINIEFNEQQ